LDLTFFFSPAEGHFLEVRKKTMSLATLVLEDGAILQGLPFGAAADAVFELVFNTSMTGY
jgi:hypothetical protein